MSVVSLPEKVHRHCQADYNDEAADPGGGKLLSIVGAEVSAEDRAHDHDATLSPNHSTGHNEGDDRDAVDDPAEHNLQGVNGVDPSNAKCAQHPEPHNPHPPASTPPADHANQLKD